MNHILLSLRNTLMALSLISAALPIACSSPDPSTSTTSASGTGSSSSSSGNGGNGGSAGEGGSGGMAGMGGAGGGASAQACLDAGGICLPQGACMPAGGTVAPKSPAGCAFDDGPAECCVPKAPQNNPMTCAEAGGLCAPIGGCLDAGGYFTSTNAGCDMGASYSCCVPHAQCGDQTIECCEPMTVYNPSCDGGKFVCQVGMPVPKGTCMVP